MYMYSHIMDQIKRMIWEIILTYDDQIKSFFFDWKYTKWTGLTQPISNCPTILLSADLYLEYFMIILW